MSKHGYLTEPDWFTDESLRMAPPTFAQLLETGLYTVEECVQILEGLRNQHPTPVDIDDRKDRERISRDGEDWWNK